MLGTTHTMEEERGQAVSAVWRPFFVSGGIQFPAVAVDVVE